MFVIYIQAVITFAKAELLCCTFCSFVFIIGWDYRKSLTKNRKRLVIAIDWRHTLPLLIA